MGDVDLTGRATEDRPFRNNKPFVDLAHPKPPLAIGFLMVDFFDRKDEPTALIPQYNILTSTSSGAVDIESIFFSQNRFAECVISATAPRKKVVLASEKPMMVRYWKCQP